MWWWQAAQWNTDRYIIPRGRMHEPALDYHKPAKRGGKRERGGADSVDRGQVGFVPFADWISRPSRALETAVEEFKHPGKGIWAMSPETIMVMLLQSSWGGAQVTSTFPSTKSHLTKATRGTESMRQFHCERYKKWFIWETKNAMGFIPLA